MSSVILIDYFLIHDLLLVSFSFACHLVVRCLFTTLTTVIIILSFPA